MSDQPTDFLVFQDPDLRLSELMDQHRDATALMNELGAMGWPELALILARAGYCDGWGVAPTAETVQLLWAAVEARRARPQSSRPAPTPVEDTQPLSVHRMAA